FQNKDVTVIGGGQSALETAALLHEEGASVRLLVRKPSLVWYGAATIGHRTRYERLLKPRNRLGDGLGHWLYDNFPGLFHHLPERVRIARVRTTLGPAGVGWLKERVVGRLPVLLGHHVKSAQSRGERVELQVTDQSKRTQKLITDHVIAATGYHYSINNLPFPSENLKGQIRDE